MDLQLQILPHELICHIVASGNLQSRDEYRQLQHRYYEQIVAEKKPRVLIDVRKLTFPTGTFDQVEVVNMYDSEMGADEASGDIRTLQVAIVDGTSRPDAARFWETYSKNRGFNFRVFNSSEEAMKWLLE